MSIQTLSKHIASLVVDFPEISLVYLFGSQVTGKVGPMSDYDLAILLDHPADGEQTRAGFSHALAHHLQTERVDVLILNRTTIELAYHVIATGKLLYQRECGLAS